MYNDNSSKTNGIMTNIADLFFIIPIEIIKAVEANKTACKI